MEMGVSLLYGYNISSEKKGMIFSADLSSLLR